MMEKQSFRFFGFVIFLVGLLLISKNINFTGFVVGSGFDVTFYFVPFVMFVGGILMMLSGDSLQAWLEKKEAVSSSDSLEGKLQTKEEEKFFKSRYSGEVPWYKRIGRKEKVSQVMIQDDDKRKGEMKKGFGRGDIEGHLQTKYEINKLSEVFPELRKSILTSKKRMDKFSKSEDLEDYYNAADDYCKATVALREALIESGMGVSGRVMAGYNNILQDRHGLAIDKEIKELKKDYVENKTALGGNVLFDKRTRIENMNKRFKLERSVPGINELEELYLKNVKTVPISKFTKKNVFFHSFPLGYNANSNTENASYDSTSNVKHFLDYINENGPMLSVSSSSLIKMDTNMSRFAGILLEDGKIYDASSKDLYSKAKEGNKLRYRKQTGSDGNFDIEHRVELALRGSSSGHNEFIVGDYQIKGLYFDLKNIKNLSSKKIKDKGEIIRDVVKTAKNSGLPLYEISESGPKRIDPMKVSLKKYSGILK